MQHRADRLMERKWGVFTHYLYREQNGVGRPANSLGRQTEWDECVRSFDVRKYVEQIARTNAGYAFITLMQGDRFLCAPNSTYDRITGYRPGEACSTRDLILDLYDELEKHGIDLYLYYTGDGPYQDSRAGKSFGFNLDRKNLNEGFVEKWASVLQEYAVRYGDKVKGWWIDGCYARQDFSGGESFGYTDALLKKYKEAVLKGNPNAIVAFNNGVGRRVQYYSALDDFTCGEMNDFVDIPDGRFLDGVQWHTLAPLGAAPDGDPWGSWCAQGVKRNAEYMSNYISRVNAKGGAVTIDIFLQRDGSFDPEQLEVLRAIDA